MCACTVCVLELWRWVRVEQVQQQTFFDALSRFASNDSRSAGHAYGMVQIKMLYIGHMHGIQIVNVNAYVAIGDI